MEKDKLTEAMGTRAPPSSPCAARSGWGVGRRHNLARPDRSAGKPGSSLKDDAGSGPTGRHEADLQPNALTPAWPERAAWGTATSLRAWQTAAMKKYFDANPRDFLAVATPCCKTTFALSVAAELLGRRMVDRITIVAPTEHLKLQWAEAAARAGIPIYRTYSCRQGQTSQDFVGIAVTYAGVAVNPLAMRIRTERFKTLVILDEVHHAGDALSVGRVVCARRSSRRRGGWR